MRIHKQRRIRTEVSFIISLLISLPRASFAEETLLNRALGSDVLSYSGFIDTALSYDFNKFRPRNRSYLTQPTRDGEGQINLAYVDARFSSDDIRGRVAAQAGSSVDLNYSSEKESAWRSIQEASVGTRIGESLWLDAGIYPSHMGAESFISRDNWSYTRLLASEFSPYYQSGAKLTYQLQETLALQFHYMNGWQNISEFDGRNAVGSQIAYQLKNGGAITYNFFLGNETEGVRIFNDFVFRAPPIGNLEMAALFDVGDQERQTGEHDQWYTWALLTRYSVCDSVKLSARVEQYLDGESVVVSTPEGAPFRTLGYSMGIDIELFKRLWWRSEYRAFLAEDPIFQAGLTERKRTDHFIVSSLSYSF